ncbi:MAG: hypothetical protein E7346_00355 [Clostridiales bacterium]|nr:hypothetical protein [Clostridiales bacterium]
MIKKAISKVSVKEKEFSLNKFYEHTEFAVGTRVCKDGLDKGILTSDISLNTLSPNRIYFINGTPYYHQDGAVYTIKNGLSEVVYTATADGTITLKGVNFKGEEGILIIEHGVKSSVLLSGTVKTVAVPDAEHYEVLGTQLFVGNKRELTFGECHDMSGFDKPIIMPRGAGEIRGLVSYGKKLLVFCQKAVYELTAFGTEMDYAIQKKTVINLDVLSGSVKRLGENVAFISEGKILCYNNGNITEITLAHSLLDFTVCGLAAGYNNLYILPVTVKGKSGYYMYAIDVVRKQEYLEKVSSPCLADGGYLLVDGKMRVMSNGEGTRSLDCVWQSKALDFGSSKKKNLSEISLKTDTPLKLTVSGRFGEKVFKVKKGHNLKKVNLTSDEFSLSLEGEQIRIDEINLKYRDMGGL